MGKSKLMIIDDDRDDLNTFIGNVHQEFEVEEVMDFDKFAVIDKIKKSDMPIEVIVLDLYEKDSADKEQPKGLEILKEIRRNFRDEELPVLIYSTTSKAHLEDAVQCIQEGAQDWIWKDHDIMSTAEKLARIKQVIEKSKTEQLNKTYLQKQENKRKIIFWSYGVIVCFFSFISIILGLLKQDYVGSFITPIFLILSLGVAWKLFGQIKLTYKPKNGSIEAEIYQDK